MNSGNICKLLDCIGRNEIDVGKLEYEKGLDSGRPVYYGEDALPDGEVIKEYSDGRKELVTFDRETGKELFLRNY